MTTKETAAAIRTTLKTAGGNRIGSPYMRDVSEAIRAVASHSLG